MKTKTAADFIELANDLDECIEAERRAADTSIARMERQRRAAWLRANRAGATYDEIVRACGVSDGKLAQEIRLARTETRSRKLSARPSQNPALR